VTHDSGPLERPTPATHLARAKPSAHGRRRPGRGPDPRTGGGRGDGPTNAVRGTLARSAGPDVEHPGRRCVRPCTRPPA